MSDDSVKDGLETVYALASPTEARAFYDGWAARYDVELTDSGYITPTRCAAALASHVDDPGAPLIEFGCGTGLGGKALHAAGFSCIDGTDISPEMLTKARGKDIYRTLSIVDLTQPLEIVPGSISSGCVRSTIERAR
jgi:predicted TPR repeat methyltransferase